MQIAPPPRSIRLVLFVVLALFVATSSADVYAKGSKSGSSGGQKTVHARGYTTKKGTCVPPHDRSAPTLALRNKKSVDIEAVVRCSWI